MNDLLEEARNLVNPSIVWHRCAADVIVDLVAEVEAVRRERDKAKAEAKRLVMLLTVCLQEAQAGLGHDSDSSICRDERFRRIIEAAQAAGGEDDPNRT